MVVDSSRLFTLCDNDSSLRECNFRVLAVNLLPERSRDVKYRVACGSILSDSFNGESMRSDKGMRNSVVSGAAAT